MGKAEKVDAEAVRRMAGRAVRAAERIGLESLSISLDGLAALSEDVRAQSAAEGAGLAAWRIS